MPTTTASRSRTGYGKRALAGIGLIALGAIGLVSSATVAAAAPPPLSGVLVLDEPMGNDPALNGTVSYVISGGTITFTFDALKNDGSPATVTEVQYCDSAVATAFTDWDSIVANTCAGTASDFPGIGEDDPVSDESSPWTFAWDEDEPYWTIHVDASGLTLYSVWATPPKTWSLTITKSVSDGLDGNDSDDEFDFTVACTNHSLAPGDATFSLGDDDTKTITGIADDSQCTVSESDASGWSTTINGHSDGDQSITVTMDEDRTVAFVNSRLAAPPTWALTVTKSVSDAQDGDNANDSFGFALSCTGHTLSAGDATFPLANGGSKVVGGIPDGSVCTLTETGAAGWTTTINGTADADRVIELTMTANATVAFANSRPAVAAAVAPAVSPAATTAVVKGVQIERSLPRTGIGTAGLAGVGTALVLFGTLLLLPIRGRRTTD